jgi:hypothetical protein
MDNGPSLEEMRKFKDLLGDQGLPQNCFELCLRDECLFYGCQRLAWLEQEERDKV